MLEPSAYQVELDAMQEEVAEGFQFIGAQIDKLNERHREMREVLEMIEKYLDLPADRDQLEDGKQRVALGMAVRFALRRW